LKFNLTSQDSTASLSVFFADGDQKVLASTHPAFGPAVAYLVDQHQKGEPHDEEHVRGLVDPAIGIGRMLQAEFGDRVKFDLYTIFLDGLPLSGGIASEVKRRLNAGDNDWRRFARFLVRLEENPSARAKNAVWDWVQKHGVSITDDGRMVGYKGLVNGKDEVSGEENVPVSYHTGPNNFVNGVLYGEPGEAYHVPHRVGDVISKRRGDVDDNNRLACSTGLHVGAYSYAKTFGENREDGARYSTMGRMADTLPNSTFGLVAFAPEDVVSVPEDNTADWKIRPRSRCRSHSPPRSSPARSRPRSSRTR
jgi:hypothetical protein